MCILCVHVKINKRSIKLLCVFGSCFRTLVVILFQIFFFLSWTVVVCGHCLCERLFTMT